MSEETTKPLTLIQKIAAIQAAAGVVKKKGKFDAGMGNANFLRIEDAVSAVNKLLTEHRLILTGTLQKKPDGSFYYDRTPHATKGYLSTLVMCWTLTDIDSNECHSWDIPGEGYDGTDKGTPKAQTSSRKYAIIDIFNLAVGNDIETSSVSFEQSREKQKNIAASKIADAAGKGNKTALDAYSQIEPEKTITITRPEEFNGHFIIVSGFIAAPPLDQFFEDTGSKRINSKQTGKAGWKVPSDYEKGLIDLCARLKVDVEG